MLTKKLVITSSFQNGLIFQIIQNTQIKGQVDHFTPVIHPQFFKSSLTVRIHGFGTDDQSVTNFFAGKAHGRKSEYFLLTSSKFLKALFVAYLPLRYTFRAGRLLPAGAGNAPLYELNVWRPANFHACWISAHSRKHQLTLL